MKYNDIMKTLAKEGLSEIELRAHPLNFQPKSATEGFLWRHNGLQTKAWQFMWNERRWGYLMNGQDVLGVELHGYWNTFTPPWQELLMDLREVTGYQPDQLLLPVVEAVK